MRADGSVRLCGAGAGLGCAATDAAAGAFAGRTGPMATGFGNGGKEIMRGPLWVVLGGNESWHHLVPKPWMISA